MENAPYISPRMLVRDLIRRHPMAVNILVQHRISPAYAYLSLELAARASQRDPKPLIEDLRAAITASTAAALPSAMPGERPAGLSTAGNASA